MAQVPPASHLLGARPPIFAFNGQAIEHFLREWSHVHVELVEDHVCLGLDTALLADNFHELAEGEWTLARPSCYPDNQALLLESRRLIALDKHLGQLRVVRHKHPVMLIQVFIRYPVHGLEGLQLLFCRVKHHVGSKNTTTVCFRQLLNDTDNSGCHLAVSLVDLLHERRLLHFFLVCQVLLLFDLVIKTSIHGHRLVVLDPLRLGQHFNCNNVSI